MMANSTYLVTDAERNSVILPLLKSSIKAAVLSGLIGLLTFVNVNSATPLYQATAKILMLAPQEQYLPQLQMVQTQNLSETQLAKTSQIKALITDRAVLSALVDQFQLNAEPAYIQKTAWQRGLAFAGYGVSSQSDQLLAVERLGNWIDIDYPPETRLLTISVRAPKPSQAANIANQLAHSYLDTMKAQQMRDFDTAVVKLQTDMQSVQKKLQQSQANLQPQTPPDGLFDEQLTIWHAAEIQRTSVLQEQASAQKSLLDHLLSRHQEARTRQSLDLLPPQARFLARATLPVHTAGPDAFLLSLKYGGGAFILLLCAMILTSLHRRQKQRRVAAFEAMSEIAPWSPSSPQDLNPTDDNHHWEALLLAEGQLNQAHGPVADKLNTAVSDFVAQNIWQFAHKRVVLMSDEADWGGQGDRLANRIASTGAALVFVRLVAPEPQENHSHISNYPGVTDLIDGGVDCSQIVFVDQDTGIDTVDAGRRALISEDFFSHDFHAFLLALEATYDLLLIDIGPHYDDEFALKSLGLARDALACIYAPETDPDLSQQVHDVMQHFGFKDSMILPLDMLRGFDQLDQQDLTEAAE